MRRVLLLLLLLASTNANAVAQAPAGGARPAAGVTPSAASPERELNLITLPTTQSLKRRGAYFRLTHRFTRDLRFGTLGDLAADLFGLDAGSIIGLEFRFAPMSNVHLALHRSNLFKDLQLSGRYDAWRQAGAMPVGVSLIASIEGDNNFQEHHQPAGGVVLSRSTAAGAVVFYASPMVVWNTPTEATGHEEHDHEHDFATTDAATVADDYTAFAGLGARFRVSPTVFAVGEYSPRVAGHAPGRGAWGVAVEKHTRGHMFQINVTNSFGTTFGQIARGGDRHNIYLGFNLARRF